MSFAYSPENLRLGKAIDVFTRPDRVVVGVRSEADRERIVRLLSPVHRPHRVDVGRVGGDDQARDQRVPGDSVTFANEIAALCEQVGADAKEVERGLKTEARIGPKAYLSPGGAFAGGTLARDIAFLAEIGAGQHQPTPLFAAVQTSNDAHKSVGAEEDPAVSSGTWREDGGRLGPDLQAGHRHAAAIRLGRAVPLVGRRRARSSALTIRR